jgi:hypothetical protein
MRTSFPRAPEPKKPGQSDEIFYLGATCRGRSCPGRLPTVPPDLDQSEGMNCNDAEFGMMDHQTYNELRTEIINLRAELAAARQNVEMLRTHLFEVHHCNCELRHEPACAEEE